MGRVFRCVESFWFVDVSAVHYGHNVACRLLLCTRKTSHMHVDSCTTGVQVPECTWQAAMPVVVACLPVFGQPLCIFCNQAPLVCFFNMFRAYLAGRLSMPAWEPAWGCVVIVVPLHCLSAVNSCTRILFLLLYASLCEIALARLQVDAG
jgi:hypothetical protein